MHDYRFDYVIVGSGLAGLYSAVLASKHSKVALITKSTIVQSNSYWAQGGIAAVIDNDDKTEFHLEDTLEAGRGLCNNEAAKVLVTEGSDRIIEFIDMGMKFDAKDGKIALGLEGGHSRRRVLHAGGDATGREIVNFIIKFVENNKNITIFENTLVHKLLLNNDRCCGVHAYNFVENKNLTITGKSVFIAAGGASAIYTRTTNPHTSLGEGISLAYDAYAEIESMEFIQFHPTSFYSESGETFLISEAVRGEGAYLVNHKGERFLKGTEVLSELAPRDVVAEAIVNEMASSGKPNVFLDLRHLNPIKIKNRFANIYSEALKHGIDITTDLVPVAPAAHYMIGGIKTGLNGQTNINGLYAVGEVASTGVHGANRLASNSLLECLVFAKRAVDHSVIKNESFQKTAGKSEEYNFKINQDAETEYVSIKNTISKIMSDNAGIIKREDSLLDAKKYLEELGNSRKFDDKEYYSSRLKSMIEISLLIVNCALLRKESRGCHNRKDYPNENENMKFTIVQKKNESPKFVSVA